MPIIHLCQRLKQITDICRKWLPIRKERKNRISAKIYRVEWNTLLIFKRERASNISMRQKLTQAWKKLIKYVNYIKTTKQHRRGKIWLIWRSKSIRRDTIQIKKENCNAYGDKTKNIILIPIKKFKKFLRK